MLRTLVDVLDFVLIVSLAGAILICVLIYLGRRSRSYILICGYLITQVLLELLIRIGEVQAPLAQWCNETLYSTVGVKGLTYSVMLVLMLLSMLSLLELPRRPAYFLPVGGICVWLICLAFLMNTTILIYWIYLLPCELFYFGLSLAGLRRLGQMEAQGLSRPFHPLLRWVLRAGMIFALAIVTEDTVASWIYGFFQPFGGSAEFGLGMAYIKERNYCESLLQLLLSWSVILEGGKELIEALRAGTKAPAAEVPGSAAGTEPEQGQPELEHYGDAIGLSPRERQIFMLLLQGKSVQEIAEVLYISPGTVKSHTHNIYQKAGVSDRKELIQAVSRQSVEKP